MRAVYKSDAWIASSRIMYYSLILRPWLYFTMNSAREQLKSLSDKLYSYWLGKNFTSSSVSLRVKGFRAVPTSQAIYTYERKPLRNQ